MVVPNRRGYGHSPKKEYPCTSEVSGDWHPAFITTADKLAQYLHAERLLIQGAGHGAQTSGKPFNDRLEALIRVADKSA
ncbi:MAG: hypothetical protein NVS4B11_00810 [Ktedonobacteraceae bacterium]